jgi:hypothetical protein
VIVRVAKWTLFWTLWTATFLLWATIQWERSRIPECGDRMFMAVGQACYIFVVLRHPVPGRLDGF